VSATFFVVFNGSDPVLNQNFGLQKLLNLGVVVAALSSIALLVVAAFSFSLVPLGRAITILGLFFASLELGLRAFDAIAISVDHSLVSVASRSVRSGDVKIFLPQSRPNSPLGFRWAHDYPIKKTGYRILMLGNSFVHGSGTSFATNYPQALEALLQRRFPDQTVTVMPAGVNGYGVVEELELYRYLLKMGYDFDAVVLNYMTGTDPSQNQAGTVLTVIAGQKQRLHDNLFLQAFYPLNYYLARYLIYFRSMSQQVDAPIAANIGRSNADGCPDNPAFDASTRERVDYYYRPDSSARVPIDVSLDALKKLGREAQANGHKFMVIVLPDRNALLEKSRNRFSGSTMDWIWIRQRLLDNANGHWPIKDLSNDFDERPDLFLCGDGHWNDQGNQLGASIAADFLGRKFGLSRSFD
jgi:hypothetical protein